MRGRAMKLLFFSVQIALFISPSSIICGYSPVFQEPEWVRIEDHGPPGDGFSGEMSAHPVTNVMYARYLNKAIAAGDVEIKQNQVKGSYAVPEGKGFSGRPYYRLDGPGWTGAGAVNGGRSRVSYEDGRFIVEPGLENHPVTYVSWYGASAYAEFHGWRLPTKNEWMAVANYDGSYIYATGDSLKGSDGSYLVNHSENDSHTYAKHGTTPVGFFGTFGYGLADMANNTWEWTSSLMGTSRWYVLKGGGWMSSGCPCSIWHGPYGRKPQLQQYHVGFRVCR